jgi:hypothetical protein
MSQLGQSRRFERGPSTSAFHPTPEVQLDISGCTRDSSLTGLRPVKPVSILPEILEPIRRHLGVSNRVHDIFVPHVVLEGSGVVPVVGELIAGGVPEHVRMDREWELCGFSSPGDCLQESRSRGRPPALGNEYISRFHILAA